VEAEAETDDDKGGGKVRDKASDKSSDKGGGKEVEENVAWELLKRHAMPGVKKCDAGSTLARSSEGLIVLRNNSACSICRQKGTAAGAASEG